MKLSHVTAVALVLAFSCLRPSEDRADAIWRSAPQTQAAWACRSKTAWQRCAS
jgi:hypothetical protein